MTRRDAVRLLVAGSGALLASACAVEVSTQAPLRTGARLLARPAQPVGEPLKGLHKLGLAGDEERDGLIYGPPSYRDSSRVPLLLLLHGGGQSADILMEPYLAEASVADAVLLAPNSRDETWDAFSGGIGPDADFIDSALGLAFSRFSIDPQRISIVGFSDGATYAIGIGRANGDLFSHIVAYSPGSVINVAPVAKPRVFITHGTLDGVLPIAATSRVIVPRLRADGYDVTYREFEGGHGVTPELLHETAVWAVA